jgi:hypothetical protein
LVERAGEDPLDGPLPAAVAVGVIPQDVLGAGVGRVVADGADAGDDGRLALGPLLELDLPAGVDAPFDLLHDGSPILVCKAPSTAAAVPSVAGEAPSHVGEQPVRHQPRIRRTPNAAAAADRAGPIVSTMTARCWSIPPARKSLSPPSPFAACLGRVGTQPADHAADRVEQDLRVATHSARLRPAPSSAGWVASWTGRYGSAAPSPTSAGRPPP